jgi:hypothetical protein
MALPVVRYVRGQDGREQVDAEHPRGWTIRLPVEWTDRAAPASPPCLNGQEVRLAARGLLELGRAIRVAMDALDPGVTVPNTPAAGTAEAGQKGDPNDGSPEGRAGRESRMGSTVNDSATRGARRVGYARAQDPPRYGKNRGGAS